MAFTYKSYTESDAVKKKRQEAEAKSTYKASDSVNQAKAALDAHEANRVADWTGGTYGDALKGAIDKIANRDKFSYDLNGDALYQQYKDQYINQGRLAMQDTIGQASAMTGGYGNSYAATAGNQAYQSYLQKLNDVVPELYQMAYDKYNQEGEDLYNQASLYNTMYNTEYGQYRDAVSDWQNEANRLSDRYYNESNLDYSRFVDNRDYYTNQYNNERSYDYGQYTDAYNRAFANYQQGVSESQYAKNLELQQQQLSETIRANMADEAYKNAALQETIRSNMANEQLKGNNTDGGGNNTDGGITPTETENTKWFVGAIMDPTTFAKHQQVKVDGKVMKTWSEYVEASLEHYVNNGLPEYLGGGNFTDEEVAFLIDKYGL